MDGRARLAGYMALDGADEDGAADGGVEKRFGEKGGSGFAIRASDAGAAELALGMAEEGGGGLSERAAAVFDLEGRQIGMVDRKVAEGLRRVGDDAEGTGDRGFPDEAVAVGRAAFHGDEDCAGMDAAGIVFDARDGFGGFAGGIERGDFSDEVVPEHAEVIVVGGGPGSGCPGRYFLIDDYTTVQRNGDC